MSCRKLHLERIPKLSLAAASTVSQDSCTEGAGIAVKLEGTFAVPEQPEFQLLT